jgi:hypothetical protein
LLLRAAQHGRGSAKVQAYGGCCSRRSRLKLTLGLKRRDPSTTFLGQRHVLGLSQRLAAVAHPKRAELGQVRSAGGRVVPTVLRQA